MRPWLLTLVLCACAVAQNVTGANTRTIRFAGAPTGSCQQFSYAVNNATGDFYDCLANAWFLVGPATGSGTVSSFSSGNLSPLFTTSVATSTTTPALSFSLSSAAAHTVLGNITGSTTAPSYSSDATIIATTSPLGGGATFHLGDTVTLTCSICITGTPTNHGIALGSATQANAYTAAGTANQLAASGGASADPSYKSLSDLNATEYIAGGGTAQAQTVTLAPAATALVNGLTVRFLPVAANTAAAPTLAVNGLTAKPITKFGTVALVVNDLTTTAIATVIYDGTEFQLLNPQSGVLPMSNNLLSALPTVSAAGTAVVADVSNTLAISQNGTLSGMFYPADARALRYRRQVAASGGGAVATVVSFGDGQTTTCSTASAIAGTTTTSQMLACLTSVTNGNAAQMVSASANVFPGTNIWFSGYGSVGTTATTRVWIGLTSGAIASVEASDTCSTFHCAAFGYSSTSAVSATNYRCVLNAGGTGTQADVDSGVTATANVPHVFDIREDTTAAKWYFFIDGVAKCASPITTPLPTSGMKQMITATNNGSGSVAAQVDIGWTDIWTDH